MTLSLRLCALLVVLVWAQEDAAGHEHLKVRRALLSKRSGRRLRWASAIGKIIGKGVAAAKGVAKGAQKIPATQVRPRPIGAIPRVPGGVPKDVVMHIRGHGLLVADLAPFLDDIPVKGTRELFDSPELIAVPVPGGVLSVPARTAALRPKPGAPAKPGVPGLREQDVEEEFFGWSTAPIWRITSRTWTSVESRETGNDITDSFCSAHGACLTHQAYEGGTCVSELPAFSVVRVTDFFAGDRSHLIVNGNRYSRTILENTTFVLWSHIAWDGLDGHFQICMEAPPLCPDGFELTPVPVEECPAGAEVLSNCEEAEPGELCEGNGQCGTRTDINNCYDSGYTYPASRDVYRKQNFTRNESNSTIATPPTTTTTTCSFTEISLEEEQVDGLWRLQGPCAVHGRCLSSPGYPGSYGENETCVASLPPFTALTVKEFNTEKFYDQLTVNGIRYSGRGLRGESFVLWSSITWTSDESNFIWRRRWRLCLDTPPMCSDGLVLTPVLVEECPASAEVLSNCEEAEPGELCEGNGQCGTRTDINNCYDSGYTYPASRDVYRKRNGTAVSWIVNGPCPVIDGCVQNFGGNASPGQSCDMSLTESGTVTLKSSVYWGSLWINRRRYGDDDSIYAIFVESTIRWNPTGDIDGDRWVICIGTRDQVQLPEFPPHWHWGGLSTSTDPLAWICVGVLIFCACCYYLYCRRLGKEESEATLEDGVLPVPTSRPRQRERSEPPDLLMESPLDLGAAWLICHADAEPVVCSDVRAHPMFRLEVDCEPPRQVWSDGSIYELEESSTKDTLRWTGQGKRHSWVRVPSCPQSHCHMMKLSKQCQEFTCARCQQQCISGCFWQCRVCQDRCLCPSCAAVPKSEQLLGISAAYVLEIFPALARQSTGLENPNFYEMAPVVAMGETGLGYGKTCSEDGEPNCSIVDAVEEHHKGKVSHFVSWCWACRLNDFVGALRAWMEGDRINASEAYSLYLWICFFCDNQYRLPKSGTLFSSANELQTVLESRLARAGQMLFLVDADTTCTKRAWCLFEVFTCVDKQLPITIMLPATREGLQEAFSTIDLRTARATSKADEDMINEVVLTGAGFDAANERVQGCLLEGLNH